MILLTETAGGWCVGELLSSFKSIVGEDDIMGMIRAIGPSKFNFNLMIVDDRENEVDC